MKQREKGLSAGPQNQLHGQPIILLAFKLGESCRPLGSHRRCFMLLCVKLITYLVFIITSFGTHTMLE